MIYEFSRIPPRNRFSRFAVRLCVAGLLAANVLVCSGEQATAGSGDAKLDGEASARGDATSTGRSGVMAREPQATADSRTWSRVIVVLDLARQGDGTYDRSAIAKAQETVLREATAAGVELEETRSFTFLPAIAAKVSAEGLAFLIKSPYVRAIEPDRTFDTTAGGDLGGGQVR